MTPMDTTGERLTYLRKRRGWSVGQLLIQAQQAAQRQGAPWKMSAATIYRYEKDERQPETWTVMALAAALQTTTDFLLGLTNDPTPCGAAGEWPVPAPEVAPLVERLNALSGARRGRVVAALQDLLRALAPQPPAQGE